MLTYDENDLNDYMLVTNIGRPLLPPVNVVTKGLPGKDKELFISSQLAGVNIPVSVTLYQDNNMSYAELKRFLAGKLYKTEPKKLVFADEPDKYYNAIIKDGTAIDDLLEAGTTTLNFYCPDGCSFGPEKTESLDGAKTNAGTYPARGRVTVTLAAPAAELRLTLVESGEYIYFQDALQAGDVIVADLEAETLTKNGTDIISKLDLGSDFFTIPVGSYTLTVSAGSGSLTYRERWL